jgi:hypothetical protein
LTHTTAATRQFEEVQLLRDRVRGIKAKAIYAFKYGGLLQTEEHIAAFCGAMRREGGSKGRAAPG